MPSTDRLHALAWRASTTSLVWVLGLLVGLLLASAFPWLVSHHTPASGYRQSPAGEVVWLVSAAVAVPVLVGVCGYRVLQLLRIVPVVLAWRRRDGRTAVGSPVQRILGRGLVVSDDAQLKLQIVPATGYPTIAGRALMYDVAISSGKRATTVLSPMQLSGQTVEVRVLGGEAS